MALPNPTPSNIRHLKPRRHITMIEDDVVETIALTMGPTALGIYTYLERKAGPDGKCHPTNAELEQFAHISLRQIQRICNDLEAAGWIKQEVVVGRFKQTLGKVYTLPYHKKPDEYRGDMGGDMGGDMDDANMSPKVDTEYLEVSTEDTPLTPHPETEAPTETDAGASKKTTREPRKKNTVVPKDFALTPELQAWGEAKEFLVSDLEAEVEPFVDYWTGRGVTRASWEATFRNWMQNQRKWNKLQSQQQARPPGRFQFSTQPDIGYTNEQLEAMMRGEKL